MEFGDLFHSIKAKIIWNSSAVLSYIRKACPFSAVLETICNTEGFFTYLLYNLMYCVVLV